MLLLLYKAHKYWQCTKCVQALSHNREKRMLDSPCWSVRLSACISSTLTVRILAKFHIWGCLWKIFEIKNRTKFGAV